MVYSGVGHAPPRNAASLVATGFIVMVEFAHFNRDEEEFPMTEDRLLIEELAAKGGQPDFLRTIAENVLQLIMEADVDGLIGAGRHERSSERATWRNGYRDRSLDTRVGTLNLKIPKLRAGSYFPGFLEPRKMVEKALVAVIQEAWIGGVSTRRVDELVQAMGMTGISKSTVSKLCKDIDERVHAFLKRPLTGEWPYLWLDATYLKVREGGRIISVAAIIAMAVNTEGRREIVGLHIGPSEAEVFWSDFLKDLVRRGLTGVKLVISDAHEGLKGAITRVMGATWQRCRVHFMRNALSYVPKGQNTVVAAAIRQVFLQPDQKSATQVWRQVADQLRTPLAQARRLHGRGRNRRARLHRLPHPAPHEVTLNQSARAAQQGGQAPRRRRRNLPERRQHHPPRRGCADGAERRVAAPAPIHADRRHGRTQPTHDRGGKSAPTHHRQSRLTMAHGHSRNYTTLTDATMPNLAKPMITGKNSTRLTHGCDSSDNK
jgi:putative transposase